MATTTQTPYIPQTPGDLITAANWNQVQVDIKADIAAQIATAIKGVTSVDHAKDADTLDGQTADQLTDAILEKAEQILPFRTGYLRTFNRLVKGTEKIIKHNLKTLPLVDVYQLDYFQAVAARGENENEPVWVNFFLYHTGERTISVKVGGTTVKAIIEAQDHAPFRIRFFDMLALYKVKYTDTTTVDDLETDFWTAFSGAPNDQYDVDQFCHSPWFEKCCGEQRSVKDLKERGDWEDIWFKMVPRRTINYPTPSAADPDPAVAPTQIEVAHHDFDTLGITLLQDPVYPAAFLADGPFDKPDSFEHELKIMVLMKV